MADEIAAEATATAEPEATPAAASAPEAAAEQPQEQFADWDSLDSLLERAYQSDPKTASDRLKKHRAIGGIAGSIAERRLSELSAQQEQERQEQASKKARDELRDMARNKPLEFADLFLNNEDANDARERILSVERNTAKKMMEQIGAAYHNVPEWKDLTDDEKAKLRSAVEGASDEETLPRFNRAALDIVADRRAARLLSDRLPKEKEAWRKEWEAERLADEQGPDLRRGSEVRRRPVNWATMSDTDFNKLWKERYGR